MSYPGKADQASSLTPQERREEADRCLAHLAPDVSIMEPHERNFVLDINDGPVSPKQLFWLRDLVEKYL